MCGNFAYVQKNHLMTELAKTKISMIIYSTDIYIKHFKLNQYLYFFQLYCEKLFITNIFFITLHNFKSHNIISRIFVFKKNRLITLTSSKDVLI